MIVAQSWSRVLRVWWSIVWKTTVIGFLLGALSGIVLALVWTAAGLNDESLDFTLQAFAYLINLLVFLVILKHALSDQYSGFRIAFVAEDSGAESETGGTT